MLLVIDDAKLGLLKNHFILKVFAKVTDIEKHESSNLQKNE